MEPNLQADQVASEPVKRLARELLVGDVITPAMLPWTQRLTEVIFTDTYALHGEHWTFVAYKDEDGHRDHALFEANRLLPLERAADPIGLSYTRADGQADDPTPVSPARAPLHVGDAESQIADDGSRLGEPGTAPVTTRPLASDLLPDGGLVSDDELVDADEPVAEPVTRYFSFGHGQTDPNTGEDLLNKYVRVVGPTPAACREAMFLSKYGSAWAFEYTPGVPQDDAWIARWEEHDWIDLTVPSES